MAKGLKDAAIAARAAQHPATNGDDLAMIAYHHPELRELVAAHPNAYPLTRANLLGVSDAEASKLRFVRPGLEPNRSTTTEADPWLLGQAADAAYAAGQMGAIELATPLPKPKRKPRALVVALVAGALAIGGAVAGVATLRLIYQGPNVVEVGMPMPVDGEGVYIQGWFYPQDTTWLDLSYSGLTNSDLKPLSQLTNLEGLDLTGNAITDIEALSALTNLWQLNLGDNSITDLSPLSNLTNLTNLNLSGNFVTDLSPLAELTNLWELGLWNNHITDLTPLAGLTNLNRLDVGENAISDLTALRGLSNLIDLTLFRNPLTLPQIFELQGYLPQAAIFYDQ
ncbi:MAG: leucine-rich repeat domain-containing protein [Propionibacteriaceae bacterium]|jgi:Leucine-rich repeat (LRR) protein|nr:leucine-rich repeat domain-containing protein [Propionibacteriaceae bacterium]